jgi:carbon storage regulator CsrA
MLVLARRPGQKVVFPGLGISVEVLRARGTVTRLGIEAPDDVVVMRQEVLPCTDGAAWSLDWSKIRKPS